jgi:hypothetical protein
MTTTMTPPTETAAPPPHGDFGPEPVTVEPTDDGDRWDGLG